MLYVQTSRLYLNIRKKYIVLKHHQQDKVRPTQLALLKSNTTQFKQMSYNFLNDVHHLKIWVIIRLCVILLKMGN